ncbi:Wide host range VirA protein [Grimontia celer]|uniref:histidine kinase n=1 Tax=Grimontia celer TaxID=1796497 RepID=A0A128F2B8_9GAMM|nr:PAS domain-containing sensor histidine kinase [Grimontia celer]CZF80937.1 Wide host range VirA protein [Grimontia celer]
MSESDELRKRIAELEAENERLKHAINIASDGIYDWQITENKLYLTGSWYKTLGYENQEVSSSIEQWQSMLHPDDVESTWKALRAHINGEVEIHEHENRLRMKNGQYRWNLDRGKVVERDENGVALRMVGIDKDITRQKHSEELNHQLAAQLMQAKKMEALGAFAGGIAHEFNNLLGIAFGLADLITLKLESTPSYGRVGEHLEKLEEVLERGRLLVKQILTFSRKQDEDRIELDLNRICEEVAHALKMSKQFTSSLTLTLPEDILVIHADSTHIHQLLTNLLINADHACKDREGQITFDVSAVELTAQDIESEWLAQPGMFAKVTIKDNGVGIVDKVLEHIYEPFFTTRAHGEGTGMGLAIVHGIISRYQGGISVKTRINEGTEFNIYLPLYSKRSEDNMIRPESLPSSGIPLEENQDQPNVVFIDDEEVMLEVVKATLPIFGLRVDTFSDPLEALWEIGREPDKYHILVTDQAMPQLTGLQVINEARKHSPGLPVVLYTGLNDFDDKIGESQQLQGFLLKPLRVNELIAHIRAILSKEGRG